MWSRMNEIHYVHYMKFSFHFHPCLTRSEKKKRHSTHPEKRMKENVPKLYLQKLICIHLYGLASIYVYIYVNYQRFCCSRTLRLWYDMIFLNMTTSKFIFTSTSWKSLWWIFRWYEFLYRIHKNSSFPDWLNQTMMFGFVYFHLISIKAEAW